MLKQQGHSDYEVENNANATQDYANQSIMSRTKCPSFLPHGVGIICAYLTIL